MESQKLCQAQLLTYFYTSNYDHSFILEQNTMDEDSFFGQFANPAKPLLNCIIITPPPPPTTTTNNDNKNKNKNNNSESKKQQQHEQEQQCLLIKQRPSDSRALDVRSPEQRVKCGKKQVSLQQGCSHNGGSVIAKRGRILILKLGNAEKMSVSNGNPFKATNRQPQC